MEQNRQPLRIGALECLRISPSMKIAGMVCILTVMVHLPTVLAEKKAVLQEVPTILKEADAQLSTTNGAFTISLRSKSPLTGAQWDAIDSIKPRHLRFNGNALDDAGMVRLVKLDPITVGINENSILTGKGVARFGNMKSLIGLGTNHSIQPTPESKDAFSHCLMLESFSTVGPFCIEALNAPKLKSAVLEHGSACDPFIVTLANHPTLERLSLGQWGGSTMTDSAFASLATLKNLKTLQIYISAHTYQGGLRFLKAVPKLIELDLMEVDLPPGDLEKLKSDLPKVKITHTEMTPEARAKRERIKIKK